MNHLTPKLIGILLLATGLVTQAHAEKVKPDYEFKELEKVRSIRDSGVDGWAAINDQALIMTVSPKRKYLVILQRPDYDLAFSYRLAVTSRSGYILSRVDKVYAMNSGVRLGVPIKSIYKLKGKAQVKLAHKLVENAELAAQQANSKSEAGE